MKESWKGIAFEPPKDFLQTAILAYSCWHALLVPGSTKPLGFIFPGFMIVLVQIHQFILVNSLTKV